MAARVAGALQAAGAVAVVAVGGDEAALAALGLTVWPDATPGEGPLGGLVDALGRSPHPVTVVVACDLPWLDGPSVAALVAALDDPTASPRPVVAFAHAGRREPLVAAWRTGPALAVLGPAFATGERAVHRAAAPLPAVDVTLAATVVRNVNHQHDLHR
jgi:molybdopterin-guanine dinucleotide biosynthesis protein A